MNEIPFDENYVNPEYDNLKAVLTNYQRGSEITCRKCFFYQKEKCAEQPCCAYERPDKRSVIFIENK